MNNRSGRAARLLLGAASAGSVAALLALLALVACGSAPPVAPPAVRVETVVPPELPVPVPVWVPRQSTFERSQRDRAIAFLQQRQADKATGRNWLFFGDQTRASDFLYREQLETWQCNGLLTKLDLAFSRDDVSKVYVQHRMMEQGAELFAWLESGAYFFVCGDASKMAVDVDKALQEVIAVHGKMSASEAKQYLVTMTNAKRYVRDVY